MPKYFIKIGYLKKPGNLLEKAVQNAIIETDQTLWPTLDQAKFMVYQKYDEAVEKYKGRAKMERPRMDIINDIDHIFTDVCNVAIYMVKKDYTLGVFEHPIVINNATGEQLLQLKKIIGV